MNTNKSKQLRSKFVVIMGSNDAKQTHIDNFISSASKIFGGLTLSQATGTWYEDAVSSKEAYTSGYACEQAYRFEILTDMPDHKAYGYIRQCAYDAWLGVADWIHVEKSVVIGAHFSLQEMDATL